MFGTAFRRSVAAMCCLLTGVAMTGSTAVATNQETVSITFMLAVPVDPYSPEFSSDLNDYLGEQTTRLQFGDRSDTVSDNLVFKDVTPPATNYCGDYDLDATTWSNSFQLVRIVNHNGDDVWAAAVELQGGGFSPLPARTNLSVDRITSVSAGWIKMDSGSGHYVTTPLDANVSYAIFIVTAEFRAGK